MAGKKKKNLLDTLEPSIFIIIHKWQALFANGYIAILEKIAGERHFQSYTVGTQIEDTGARTLELPLLVRRLVYSFRFVSTRG